MEKKTDGLGARLVFEGWFGSNLETKILGVIPLAV
jgi:hypothetical protein